MKEESAQSPAGKLTPGEKFRLREQISFVTGSIVSRVLEKSAGGNVTLFAFDAGQGLSEHTAPFNALVNVLEGEADIKIGTSRMHLVEGDSVLMPANITHSVQATVPMKMLLVMIRS